MIIVGSQELIMTINEYRKKLNKLSDEKFKSFNEDFGGGQKTREERVREYVDNPKYERRICQLLGLKTQEEKTTKAIQRTVLAASISAAAAVLAIIFSYNVWSQGKPTRRPVLAVRKGGSAHKKLEAQNKLQINLYLQFINIGKHPAGNVCFRSCFGPLFDPNQLHLSKIDLKCANTIYPENEYNPWEQLSLPLTDLPKIRDSSLFYYCRLDYQDTFDHNESYDQDFYFIYNIDRKKLQHATLEHKEQFQQQINKLIPLVSN